MNYCCCNDCGHACCNLLQHSTNSMTELLKWLPWCTVCCAVCQFNSMTDLLKWLPWCSVCCTVCQFNSMTDLLKWQPWCIVCCAVSVQQHDWPIEMTAMVYCVLCSVSSTSWLTYWSDCHGVLCVVQCQFNSMTELLKWLPWCIVCCAVCQFLGQTFQDNSRFTHPDDDCQTCTCKVRHAFTCHFIYLWPCVAGFVHHFFCCSQRTNVRE